MRPLISREICDCASPTIELADVCESSFSLMILLMIFASCARGMTSMRSFFATREGFAFFISAGVGRKALNEPQGVHCQTGPRLQLLLNDAKSKRILRFGHTG